MQETNLWKVVCTLHFLRRLQTHPPLRSESRIKGTNRRIVCFSCCYICTSYIALMLKICLHLYFFLFSIFQSYPAFLIYPFISTHCCLYTIFLHEKVFKMLSDFRCRNSIFLNFIQYQIQCMTRKRFVSKISLCQAS